MSYLCLAASPCGVFCITNYEYVHICDKSISPLPLWRFFSGKWFSSNILTAQELHCLATFVQLHMPLFVSSLSLVVFFFSREESFSYTIVIAVWHVVPYFTISEMSFCVGSGSPTTLTWGPAATRSQKCNDLSCLPTLGWAECCSHNCSCHLSDF